MRHLIGILTLVLIAAALTVAIAGYAATRLDPAWQDASFVLVPVLLIAAVLVRWLLRARAGR